MRAIIIEDEILAAIHLETTLERLGIEALGVAQDKQGAIALADKQPDLALVDLNLRDGFTGPQVAAELARRGISVLFVTANPDELEGLNHLGSPVLEKPLEPTHLARMLEALGKAPGDGRPSSH